MTNSDNKDIEDSGIIYFSSLIVNQWKELLITYITVGVLSVIILLLLPNWYKSEATVVLLENNNSSGIASLLQDFSPLGLNLGGGDDIEKYMGYVKTRKLFDKLDTEFNLMKAYDIDKRDDLYSALEGNINVYDNENGSFTISFSYEENAEKAAEILQLIYDEVYRISLEVDQVSSSNYREYLESYLNKVESDVESNVGELIKYQSKTGIISLPNQLKATIDILAVLETSLIQIEIERSVLSKSTDSSSNIIRSLNNQIETLNEKITSLQKDHRNTILAIDGLPEKAAEYLQLESDVVINKKILELIRIQYEQALMDEKKISSNLYLLDKPSIPENKFKPSRSKILFVILFFTFILSALWLRSYDFYKKNKKSFQKMIK